jgi:hypothetical protein
VLEQSHMQPAILRICQHGEGTIWYEGRVLDTSVVQRRVLLQDLVSSADDDAKDEELTIPSTSDAFSEWLAFDTIGNDPEQLCRVIHVPFCAL